MYYSLGIKARPVRTYMNCNVFSGNMYDKWCFLKNYVNDLVLSGLTQLKSVEQVENIRPYLRGVIL